MVSIAFPLTDTTSRLEKLVSPLKAFAWRVVNCGELLIPTSMSPVRPAKSVVTMLALL